MKYCRFLLDGEVRYGEVEERGGEFWIAGLIPAPEEDLPSHLAAARRDEIDLGVWEYSAGQFEPVRLVDADLLPPVTPSKIICVGRNYRDHAKELGNEVPAEPLLFFKPPSSLLAPGGVVLMPHVSTRVDFEGELALVIGRRASKLAANADWRSYIRGYTIANDVTARDLQKKDGQWTRAKGFDTFCPVGPYVSDEVDPAAGIGITTHLNGGLRQDGNTRHFDFSIDPLPRYITAALTPFPG